MPQRGTKKKDTVVSGQKVKISVLNPSCSSQLAQHVPLAARTFSSLENKVIYLVDIGWGGPEAGYDLFQVMQDWFAQHLPSVKTLVVKKKGMFAEDDPDLWNQIKADEAACIIGLSC
jgi:hypothetical protein